MDKGPEEWLKQSDYDIKTAEAMFDARRYVYVVFMCHLSLEKALKGLYQKKLRTVPPKVHNLIFTYGRICARRRGYICKLNRVHKVTMACMGFGSNQSKWL